MRDPSRIPLILMRLEALWRTQPDLRLGQLIGNVYNYSYGQDPYFDEDAKFIKKLEEFYHVAPRRTP